MNVKLSENIFDAKHKKLQNKNEILQLKTVTAIKLNIFYIVAII